MLTDKVITLATALAKHRGRELSTISTEVANGGHVLGALESGARSATERKLKQYIEWFSFNWPQDLEWPEDIARPVKTGGAEEESGA